jgi:hypothetical protein
VRGRFWTNLALGPPTALPPKPTFRSTTAIRALLRRSRFSRRWTVVDP